MHPIPDGSDPARALQAQAGRQCQRCTAFALQHIQRVHAHGRLLQPDLAGPWRLCLHVFKLHDIGSAGAIENDASSHDRILLGGCSSQANQTGKVEQSGVMQMISARLAAIHFSASASGHGHG
ncbi:hypothetical protein D3C77_533590 [compost metagenome]